jgi:hypothetical protein
VSCPPPGGVSLTQFFFKALLPKAGLSLHLQFPGEFFLVQVISTICFNLASELNSEVRKLEASMVRYCPKDDTFFIGKSNPSHLSDFSFCQVPQE